MQEHDEQQLSDGELDAVLRAWQVPDAPAAIRQRVFAGREERPWWRFFVGSIRVPVPVAVCLVVMIVAGFVVTSRPRVVYREVLVPLSSVTFQGLQPVTELRPRIIRRSHAEN